MKTTTPNGKCPYCNSDDYSEVDSKYTKMECNNCKKRFWGWK